MNRPHVFYELKPDTGYGRSVGPKQVRSYATALHRSGQYRGAKPGKTTHIVFNATHISPFTGRSYRYWQENPGMIYYEPAGQSEERQTMSELTQIPDLASVSVPGRQGNTSPVPEQQIPYPSPMHYCRCLSRICEYSSASLPSSNNNVNINTEEAAILLGLIAIGAWAILSPDPIGEIVFGAALAARAAG